jgi:phosphoribosylformylglycinamidine synthase
MKSVNVLAFPGTNCEIETVRAVRRAGFSSRILLWCAEEEEISSSDGLVIAGGFSFEDRGRSGIISAMHPVAEVVRNMAKRGKPILGICNGAQILIEIGLIPGLFSHNIEMSLSRNRREKDGKILGSGFYHDFIYVTPEDKECVWTQYEGILHLPIAHGEGRFVGNPEILSLLKKNKQCALLYCSKNGDIDPHFPVNPNGSSINLAAVSNPQGNVMAMMPHPERNEEGQQIFRSLHSFFSTNISSPTIPPVSQKQLRPTKALFSQKKKYKAELYISLHITDNTEKSIEQVARNVFSKQALCLHRQLFWGIRGNGDIFSIVKKLLDSEEFFNENKESVFCRIGEEYYAFEEGKLIKEERRDFGEFALLSQEKDDILAQEKSAAIKKHIDISVELSSGVLWSFSEPVDKEHILKSALFGNSISWNISQVST